MTDNIYYFNKISKIKNKLGEIQSGFNQSFVLDGTKDSCKVVVYSYNITAEMEPYTILWHENTNTWWVVAHDKVERYENEMGFWYSHELSLNGGVELLNARDLTDCGFNQGRYTVREFIKRLFALSNFEYDFDFSSDSNDAIDLDKNVDFLKTYENYTLLSALRDFLEGYNCDAKLDFVMDQEQELLESAVLNIVSKTGNQSYYSVESYFNDVKEIKSMDKNSFGTTVVSNAENVVSTRHKTYPMVGTVKLSANEYKATSDNAVLRLPSKVFKANWLEIITDIKLIFTYPIDLNDSTYNTFYIADPTDDNAIDKFIEDAKELIDLYSPSAQKETLKGYLDTYKADIKQTILNAATIKIYDGNVVDPTYNNGAGKIIKGPNVPKLIETDSFVGGNAIPITLIEKNEANNLPNKDSGVIWERGSNIITHFNFITGHAYAHENARTVSTWSMGAISVSFNFTDGTETTTYNNGHITWGNFSVRCNYVPMSDIKIKVDNQQDKCDIQLYNQNGKLTDSKALSKLLNSYAKEISSDTITKYWTGYDYSQIKKVGQLFKINNEMYVANNLSIDLYPNDTGYYIECEYTLSKQFAVKSLMVNPNTNIRDYGIPQNYNVARKQVYRDYYEFDYSTDFNADDDIILPIDEVLGLDYYPIDTCNYVGVIKCGYTENIGGQGGTGSSDEWYYQLDTTKYELDKMVYVVLNFNDNNIIGYGAQNVYSGFDITRLFTSWFDNTITPISYVDNNGEVESIEIAFCDNETISSIYDEYKIDQGYGSQAKSLYNITCFIPEDVFNAAKTQCQMKIKEQHYNKDALEIPVFEYCTQIGDSRNVLVGDNILSQEQGEEYIYFYGYRFYDANTRNIDNVAPHEIPYYVPGNTRWACDDTAKLTIDDTDGLKLIIELFGSTGFIPNTENFVNYDPQTIKGGKDLAIFKFVVNRNTYRVERTDTLMVIKNIPSTYNGNSNLPLIINHYKLK